MISFQSWIMYIEYNYGRYAMLHWNINFINIQFIVIIISIIMTVIERLFLLDQIDMSSFLWIHKFTPTSVPTMFTVKMVNIITLNYSQACSCMNEFIMSDVRLDQVNVTEVNKKFLNSCALAVTFLFLSFL